MVLMQITKTPLFLLTLPHGGHIRAHKMDNVGRTLDLGIDFDLF